MSSPLSSPAPTTLPAIQVPSKRRRSSAAANDTPAPAPAPKKKRAPAPKKPTAPRRAPSSRGTRAPAAPVPRTVAEMAAERAKPLESVQQLHPGAPDMSAPRRTPAEVAANTAAVLKRIRELEQQRESAIAEFAQLQAAQDATSLEEEQSVVLTVDDHLASTMDVDHDQVPSDDDMPFFPVTDEMFQRIENDEHYASDEEYAPTRSRSSQTKSVSKAKDPKPKKPKNLKKGELRVAVEDKIQQVKEDAAAASKHAGVVPGFKQRRSTVNTSPSPPISPVGGLNDQDAVSTRPVTFGSQVLRENDAVSISSDEDETPVAAPRRPKRDASVTLLKRDLSATLPKHGPSHTLTKRDPLPKLDLEKLTKSKAKTKSTFTLHIPSQPPATPSTSATTTPGAASTPAGATTTASNALPPFLAPRWVSDVLPVFHRGLGASENPWEFGGNNATSIAFVQKTINDMFPENTYTVQWGDAIMSRLYARSNERRSGYGQAGVNVFVQYLADNADTLKTPEDIANFTPTPRKYLTITDPRHPKYQRPKGLFESEFVIGVLAPMLKVGLDPAGCAPVGAVALAAAAVERGLMRYRTGVPSSVDKFSKSTSGTAVAGYIVSAKQLSEQAWERIIEACNVPTAAQSVSEDKDDNDPITTLDGNRENLYEPSSPPASPA
ncbi:hypothetical protein FB45DRAFT_1098565 [Roridomyces roridus]|uniref:Uncharacterized protein n=1 Tax=Roridomyces roridus TaxID=1738132 RepID=A0AAD7FW54_9AGAR|nr:hypothetical protein FB45DRAFT_1098565 [Roridomyces roridus]